MPEIFGTLAHYAGAVLILGIIFAAIGGVIYCALKVAAEE